MVTWLGTFYKIAIAVSPAVLVLVLTIVISFVTEHPEGPEGADRCFPRVAGFP